MAAVVTLLTDFGLRDSYVAEMKAVLLSGIPAVDLVDVTHEVPPGAVASAAYLLSRFWHRFPAGSVHVIVVDPGVGSSRRCIAAEANGHRFVAPDNGVLTPVLDEAKAVVALEVPDDASPTFHGRDVFAPAAAKLATRSAVVWLGEAIDDPVRLPDPVLPTAAGDADAVVIHVDRFGNVITNVPARWRVTAVEVGGTTCAAVGRTFADVEEGELVVYPGSGGTWEVAVRGGSARDRLGVEVGASVAVRAEPDPKAS